jgi:hypothetical protein
MTEENESRKLMGWLFTWALATGVLGIALALGLCSVLQIDVSKTISW